MTGLLIAAAIVFLLAIMPLGVSIRYDADGAVIRLIAGLIKIQLLPGKIKEKKPGKADRPKAAKEKKAKKPQESKPSGGSITDFIPLVKIALELLNDFRWKMRISRLELKLIMAGGDPCDLATNYGKAWIALGNLWPRLESFLVIKKRDVQIECDFFSDKTLVNARVDLTITLGRIIHLGLKHGIRALRELLRLKNMRKGGALK